MDKTDRISSSAIAGIEWLLGLQNRDGGVPTFCQGWGALPFDKSSTDLTAHAIRAFQAWRKNGGLAPSGALPGALPGAPSNAPSDALPDVPSVLPSDIPPELLKKMERAEERMFSFLERAQQKDGSWLPLWFGNQFVPDDANPCYGTAKVLLAFAETKRESRAAQEGLRYLIGCQNEDGGWGREASGVASSVEETAVVVEVLSAFADRAEVTAAYHRGLNWLLEAVESDRFTQASPIGLYFAKLWYYEDLYPVIFTATALRRALMRED